MRMTNLKDMVIHIRVKTIATIEIDNIKSKLHKPIINHIHTIKELIQPPINQIQNTINKIIEVLSLKIQIEKDKMIKMKEYTVVEALTRKGL